MSKVMYRFNRKKALEVLPVLLEHYENETYIFSKDKIFLPDERLPENVRAGSRRHALFLFTYAPLTARTTSNNLYDYFKTCFRRHPDFLDKSNKKELERILRDEIGSGFVERHAKGIVDRREVLKKDYGNDPRKIFAVHKDPREAIAAMAKEMFGYAHKTASPGAQFFLDLHVFSLSIKPNVI